MKRAKEWEEELRKTHYGPEPKAGVDGGAYERFIRSIQRDAFESALDEALAACDEVARANLDIQEEPLDRDELRSAEGAYDGARDCATLVRKLKCDASEVPLGNNPATEEKR